MRIEIENIGKIRRADVDLSTVAVLAGENNSGKSTVGKVLYSIARAMDESADLGAKLSEDFEEVLRFEADKGSVKIEGDMVCDLQVDDEGQIHSGDFSKGDFNFIYIDDPNILDFKVGAPYLPEVLNSRRMDLINMLANKNGQGFASERINALVDGDLIIKNNEFFYSKNEGLSMHNTSSGLKMFLILKTLFANGWVGNKSVLIFDEPEVHLHPEWQLVFAKTCIDLVKKYQARILLNTHSPYLVEAFEVYSAKEKLNAKFYLTENSKDFADIVNVTKDIDLIYKGLAEPFSKLEAEAYE